MKKVEGARNVYKSGSTTDVVNVVGRLLNIVHKQCFNKLTNTLYMFLRHQLDQETRSDRVILEETATATTEVDSDMESSITVGLNWIDSALDIFLRQVLPSIAGRQTTRARKTYSTMLASLLNGLQMDRLVAYVLNCVENVLEQAMYVLFFQLNIYVKELDLESEVGNLGTLGCMKLKKVKTSRTLVELVSVKTRMLEAAQGRGFAMNSKEDKKRLYNLMIELLYLVERVLRRVQVLKFYWTVVAWVEGLGDEVGLLKAVLLGTEGRIAEELMQARTAQEAVNLVRQLEIKRNFHYYNGIDALEK